MSHAGEAGSAQPLNVLIIEDSPEDADLVVLELRRAGFAPAHKRVDSPAGMSAALAEREWDLVLCDYTMPRFSPAEALTILQQRHCDLPFVIVSANLLDEAAVGLMREGARDIIMKPNLARLGEAVRRELDGATRRKQADRALAESHQQVAAILESIGDAFIAFDRQWRYVYVNRKAAELSGKPPEELLGRNVWQVFPQAVGNTFYTELHRVASEGKHLHFEEFYPAVNRWLEADAYPSRDGVSVFIRNITDRKLAEEAARKWQEIFKHAAFGMAIADPHTHTLQDVNPAFARMHGYTAEELIGRPLTDTFAPESRAELPMHARIAHERGHHVYESVHIRKDGSRFPVLTDVTVFKKDNGDPLFRAAYFQDVTESQRAKEILRESERRFRTLTSHAPVGIFQTDREGKCLFVNESWCEMAGMARDEALGEGWARALHPDDRARVLDEWSAAARQGIAFSSEYRFQTPQGQITWLQGSAHPLRNDAGEIAGYIGTITGVTAHKQALEELRKTKRQLADILESITEAFIALDRDWRFTYVNNQIVNALGMPPTQILGKKIWDLFPGAIDTEFYPQYLRVMTEKIPVQFQTFYAPRNQWFEVHAHPTEEGLSAYIVDITARKHAEDALLRSEQRFRALIENSTDGILLADYEGTIFYIGHPILGYSNDEWVGRKPQVLIHPEDLEATMQVFREVRAEPGRVMTTQYRARHKDGSWRWVETVAKNLLDDPDVHALVINYRDVTERKRFEDQLRQAQKLESLGVLAGGVAHDFNNLLVGIMGNASLALDMLSRVHPVRPMIQEVLTASERAANLTRQMLAYSGKGRFVIEPIDISELVREMVSLLHTSVPRNVQLRQELGNHLPAIEADVTQMQQLVMNLVLNGAEAIGERPGIVTVRTGSRLVDEPFIHGFLGGHEVTPGPHLYIEVQDTGAGMNRETIQKIFDPFFTTKATGRGLGLAAALGIVRGHKGAIRIVSTPGQGTTFTVVFPATDGAAPTRARIESEENLRGGGTILVVDDEDVVRRTTKMALERYGYQVLLAENGMEAIEAFERAEHDIALVLLDLSMPVMGGEDCLCELQALCPELAVILSSGFNEADAIRRFAGKGLAGFIQKPYTAAQLAEKIKIILDRPENKRSS